MNKTRVPTDLDKVLAAAPKAKALWEGLTPLARRDFISWIDSAKRLETRARRVESVPSRLMSGKRRPCCHAVVPINFHKALGTSPTAKAAWKKLSPDERRDFVDWIDSAKDSETRGVRIAKACSMIAAGKRQPARQVPVLRQPPQSLRAGAPMLQRTAGLMILMVMLRGGSPAFGAVPDGSIAKTTPPNIVIILTDDHGYADVGVFGAQGFETPNLDRMAAQGMRFTDFYSAQPICSASRAGLLTGCYPNRVGIMMALGPNANYGVNDDEVTLAELCKSKGYATAMFGKWHLGHHPQFLPTHHGFDEYFGLPYSNDMWPEPPHSKAGFPNLPLIEGDKVVKPKVTHEDQKMLTTWYTQHAVSFIERNKDHPFFLYVAHNMPHVPLHVSDKFAGKSSRGLYGDVIEEIDWSVGQVLDSLKKNGLDERTLVIFTSDNGPCLIYGDHAGRADPLREGKSSAWDGGVRVPCIMRWPGRIPAGSVCREPAMTIDLLPTLAKLADAPLPPNRIDGLDIWPLISADPSGRCPHKFYALYMDTQLHAIRSGRWSLHLPHGYGHITRPGTGGTAGEYEVRRTGLALFDMGQDPGQTTNLAAGRPEIVKKLLAYAEDARQDLGDSLTGRKGSGVRPAGRLR